MKRYTVEQIERYDDGVRSQGYGVFIVYDNGITGPCISTHRTKRVAAEQMRRYRIADQANKPPKQREHR